MHFTRHAAPMSLLTLLYPAYVVHLSHTFLYALSPPFLHFPSPSRVRYFQMQLTARSPLDTSGELISVISRSCNSSRPLHGQLIIIAIPIADDLDNGQLRWALPTGKPSEPFCRKTDFRFAYLPMGFLVLIRTRPCVGGRHYCPKLRVIFRGQRLRKYVPPVARYSIVLEYYYTCKGITEQSQGSR